MQVLILKPDWQCSTCTAALKIQRGCDTDATKPLELDGEKQMRCPRRMLLDYTAYMNEVWWLYGNYKEGILPEHGGLYDQPAKLLAVIRVLDSTKSAANSEKEEIDRRKAAARARASDAFNAG